MENREITDLDINQFSRRMYDINNEAQRVILVGQETPEFKLPENFSINVPVTEKQVIVKEIQIEKIEIPTIVYEKVIERIEVPVIVKEVQIVEVPVIVKEIEFREIEKIVNVETIKNVEIPVVTTIYKEIPMPVVSTEKLPEAFKVLLTVQAICMIGACLVYCIKSL